MCEFDYIPRCTCWMWQCFESMSLAYPLQLIHFCCFRNAAARYTYQADALAPGAEWCFRRCFHVESMPRTWRCYLQTLWASLGATSPKMLLVLYCSYSQWQTHTYPYYIICPHICWEISSYWWLNWWFIKMDLPFWMNIRFGKDAWDHFQWWYKLCAQGTAPSIRAIQAQQWGHPGCHPWGPNVPQA